MAKEGNQMEMPGAFGGLMRYKDEYNSLIKFSPYHIIGYVLLVAIFVTLLKVFRPI